MVKPGAQCVVVVLLVQQAVVAQRAPVLGMGVSSVVHDGGGEGVEILGRERARGFTHGREFSATQRAMMCVETGRSAVGVGVAKDPCARSDTLRLLTL